MPQIAIGELANEVFFHIGLTLYAAQSFEQGLIGLLTGLHVTENPSDWHKNYIDETERLKKIPLGGLLKRARNLVDFGHDVELTLLLALERRNHFIHKFYAESFGLLTDVRGHNTVLESLIEYQSLFRKADDMIEPISYQLMIKAGMTEAQILAFAQRSIQDQLKG